MTAFIKKRWLTVVFALLSVALMFAAWALSWRINGNEIIVPSIGGTLSQFFRLFGESGFWKALGMTLARTLLSVLISFLLAALCTVLGLIYTPFKSFFAPIIAVFRTVPTVAVTLVIMLTFKTFTPVVVTLLVVFPKSYGVKKRAVLTKIIIPQIAPAIIMQLGTVISFGLKLTISAEILSYVNSGIGDMIKAANFATQIARLSALTLASVAVGLLIEGVFFIITKVSFRWRRV